MGSPKRREGSWNLRRSSVPPGVLQKGHGPGVPGADEDRRLAAAAPRAPDLAPGGLTKPRTHYDARKYILINRSAILHTIHTQPPSHPLAYPQFIFLANVLAYIDALFPSIPRNHRLIFLNSHSASSSTYHTLIVRQTNLNTWRAPENTIFPHRELFMHHLF